MDITLTIDSSPIALTIGSASGAIGPAPGGTGLVSVTAGVLDTPTTLSARVAADATNLRTQLGLGSAATTNSSAYATAAQGGLADSAVQPGDLGTAAYTASTDYATAAQGTDSREWTAATIEQAEAEAGTATTRRAWTALRVRQAIAAWWATIGKSIGGYAATDGGKLAEFRSGGYLGATGFGLTHTVGLTSFDAQFYPTDNGKTLTYSSPESTANFAITANADGQVQWGELGGVPSTFAPIIGSGAADAVAGNDARLTDARTPTAHTQAASTISDSTTTGRALLTAANASAAMTTLELGNAAVRDTSTGGNGVSDENKVVVFGEGGSVAISGSFFLIGSYSATTKAENLTYLRIYQEPNASGVKALTDNTSGIPDKLTNGIVTNYTESVVSIGTVTTSNTLALTNGTRQRVRLTASTACTFTMPTATDGKSFVLEVEQAATTGLGTATFTGVNWGNAGAPTITPTAGKMDIITFMANGTKWFGAYNQGFTY